MPKRTQHLPMTCYHNVIAHESFPNRLYVYVSIKKSKLINKAKVACHSEITILYFSNHGMKTIRPDRRM
jgi:hypothetical protein